MNTEDEDSEPVCQPTDATRRAVLGAGLGTIAASLAGCALPPPLSPAQAAAPEGSAAPRSRMEGRIVLVTGAARGIGRAICLACASEGADIIGLDIAGPIGPTVPYPPSTLDDLAATGELVAGLGRRFQPAQADVRDLAALTRIAAAAEQAFGGIDVLVANAGITTAVKLADMTDRDWHDVIDVNLSGVANSMRAVLPGMVRRGGGRIMAISSVQGRQGTSFAPHYVASKWGVIGLVKSAALEFGHRGVTVNAICPTLVNTVMGRSPALHAVMAPDEAPKPPPESLFAAAMRRTHPLRVPWIEPEDVAAAVVFLASEQARYVSGSAIDVTAGIGGLYTA